MILDIIFRMLSILILLYIYFFNRDVDREYREVQWNDLTSTEIERRKKFLKDLEEYLKKYLNINGEEQWEFER